MKKLLLITAIFIYILTTNTVSGQFIRNKNFHKKIFPYKLISKYVSNIEEIDTNNQEIVDFRYTVYNGEVYLKWLVKTNTNSCVFFVERSKKGNKYKLISIKRNPGHNIKINNLVFYFHDKKAEATAYYYRIKQVNHDGTRYTNEELICGITPKDIIETQPKISKKEKEEFLKKINCEKKNNKTTKQKKAKRNKTGVLKYKY